VETRVVLLRPANHSIRHLLGAGEPQVRFESRLKHQLSCALAIWTLLRPRTVQIHCHHGVHQKSSSTARVAFCHACRNDGSIKEFCLYGNNPLRLVITAFVKVMAYYVGIEKTGMHCNAAEFIVLKYLPLDQFEASTY
jgi:hypothetical protein